MSHKIFDQVMVAPDEEDFESAAFNGVWYPECPYCGEITGAEPDADWVACQSCSQQFRLVRIV